MENNIEVYICPMTEQEVNSLNGFKLLLREKGIDYNPTKFDDSYLIRFLRARKLDLNKALEMFKECLNWRKEKKIDTANFSFPEFDKIKLYYPHGLHKVDKLGRPIYLDILGEVKIDELLKLASPDRLLLYQVSLQEKLLNEIFPICSASARQYVGQALSIIDLKKLSTKLLSKKFYNFFKLTASVSQNYFPEILGQLFIINTGFLFKAAWTICKAFIDDKTKKKIITLGSDYKKKLLEFVDEDNLPKFLGGNCSCEPYGCIYSNRGPWWKEEEGLTPEIVNSRKKTEEGDDIEEIDNNYEIDEDGLADEVNDNLNLSDQP